MTPPTATMDATMACTCCGAMSLFDTDWQDHPEEPVVCPNCLAAIAVHLHESRGERRFAVQFSGELVIGADELWEDNLPEQFDSGTVFREVMKRYDLEPDVLEVTDVVEIVPQSG